MCYNKYNKERERYKTMMTREERILSRQRYHEKQELLKIANKSAVITASVENYSNTLYFYCSKHTKAVDNLINKAKEFCPYWEEKHNAVYLQNWDEEDNRHFLISISFQSCVLWMYSEKNGKTR